MFKTPMGYKAICEQLKLSTFPHYCESYLVEKGRGKMIVENNHEIYLYPKAFALREQSCLNHLEFALKHEGVNLETIKALFQKIEKKEVAEYVKKKPAGIYSRKIWYLYESMTQSRLDIYDCKGLKYVDLLDTNTYFTSNSIKSSRHAINDNLLGNFFFCPFVRKTKKLEKYLAFDLGKKVKHLLQKYDPRLVERASNYLYAKETMSSYEIERERPDKSRIARFVNLLQQASKIEILSKEKMIELQNIIVDPRYKDSDYREKQNYVGETVSAYNEIVHYISPKPEDVSVLMEGLLSSLDRMLESKVHPVIIAAVISFGFVFIHPFEDGNGRIHRFLIHYILSKTNFTSANMIFPVSSVMLQNMHDYDQTLESFSKPLLSVLTDYHLSDEGVLTVNQESRAFYQHIDYTAIVEYLFECIEKAIDVYIESEIEFLMNYDKSKKAVQEIVDMPDNQIDLLIKLVLQNKGKLSKAKKNKYFSKLTEKEVESMVNIIWDFMQK